ncbi:hypothetical protein ES703_103444 [subsurface metagenome]
MSIVPVSQKRRVDQAKNYPRAVERVPGKSNGQDYQGGEKTILRQQKQIIAIGFGYSGGCWVGFVLKRRQARKKAGGGNARKKGGNGKGERSGGRRGGWGRPPYKQPWGWVDVG